MQLIVGVVARAPPAPSEEDPWTRGLQENSLRNTLASALDEVVSASRSKAISIQSSQHARQTCTLSLPRRFDRRAIVE
jgi:hypothetical protein